jgi:hypothetical protein
MAAYWSRVAAAGTMKVTGRFHGGDKSESKIAVAPFHGGDYTGIV